jgi:hypothetical protein
MNKSENGEQGYWLPAPSALLFPHTFRRTGGQKNEHTEALPFLKRRKDTNFILQIGRAVSNWCKTWILEQGVLFLKIHTL